MAFVQKSLLI